VHLDTTLLWSVDPARFSEFDGKNSFPVDAFSKKIFRQEDNFSKGKNKGEATAPPVTSCPGIVSLSNTQRPCRVRSRVKHPDPVEVLSLVFGQDCAVKRTEAFFMHTLN